MTFTFKDAAVTIESLNGDLGDIKWVTSGNGNI
jgi:hypothetical protein